MMQQACHRASGMRASIVSITSGATTAAPKQPATAWRRGVACRGWQSWAEGSTSTSDDRTRGTSTTKEYLRNSEHDSAHSTFSSSNGYGFPSFDDVPDFFSSNPTYQPAVQHDSTSTYSASHHNSNASNGNGYHFSSWDSSPSHHSTTSDNADAFHSSSYEEAGGGFFYDQGSQDVSGESAYSFYPSGAYSNGSSDGRAFGSSPSSVGYSANGAGDHYSSYQAPHDTEDSGSKHSDQDDEEEQEGGSGGFFNPAFAAAFQAALQRTAESESSTPLTSQASYQEDEAPLPRTPLPLPPQPRREEEPASAAVDVLSAAFDASMTSINRLMAIKGEVERAIEREKLQLARLEFALDKTKKDDAYYRVLRVMQERGASDMEDA